MNNKLINNKTNHSFVYLLNYFIEQKNSNERNFISISGRIRITKRNCGSGSGSRSQLNGAADPDLGPDHN